jgi:hypothetical protein
LRAWTEEYTSDNAYVLKDGNINWGRVHSRNLAPSLEPGKKGETVGNSAFYLNETLLPQRDKGEINTGTEFWNDKTEPRQAWREHHGTIQSRPRDKRETTGDSEGDYSQALPCGDIRDLVH